MIFRQLFERSSSTYTYLLADPNTREAILIDPVFETHSRDTAMLREMDLNLLYTLDTHVHADHVTGAWLMKKRLGSEIVLSRRYNAEKVDREVDDGDIITFGDYAVKILATPGHTAGCLSFVVGDDSRVFTGDCLLIRGAGRTDFQQGSAQTLYHSIKEKLFILPDNCEVYPGHDYSGRTMSMISEEKRFNARIGGDATQRDFVGYMDNLNLPHPKKLDIAVPANMRCGYSENEDALELPDWGPVIVNYAGIAQLEPEWLHTHRNDVLLLDVRSSEEFQNEGHIEGSTLIPLDQLQARIDEVPKGKPIVTICHSGTRSGRASLMLRKVGHKQVANLVGGLVQWRKLSYPLQ